MTHINSRRILSIAVVTGAWLRTADAPAAVPYGAECAEDYTACSASNLPNSCDNVTNSTNAFNSVGWTRTLYYPESQAWPHDWYEAATVPGGLDNIFMDASSRYMAIWSGHGVKAPTEPNNQWKMAFGAPHNGTCYATSPGQLIYGENYGSAGWGNDGKNEYVVMDASCSMIIGEISKVWQNWGPGIMMGTQQAYGFHNSPIDNDLRLDQFATAVAAGESNKSAWLEAGEVCYVFFCIDSPAVITHGFNQADANSRHETITFRGSLISPSGWGGAYAWSWIDNGTC